MLQMTRQIESRPTYKSVVGICIALTLVLIMLIACLCGFTQLLLQGQHATEIPAQIQGISYQRSVTMEDTLCREKQTKAKTSLEEFTWA